MSAISTLHEGFYTLDAPGGRVRVRSIIDQQLQADFARWHYQRAMADLRDSRELYTDAEYAVERDKLRAEYRNGLYDFKSAKGAETLATPPGIAFVFSRLVEGLEEGKALEFIAGCQAEAGEILQRVIEDSFPELIKAGRAELERQKKRAAESRAPTTTPTGAGSPGTAPPY